MVLVSVVVPIYNVEKYLDECLLSIQNQTLKDIEVICVNDGSTDSSLDIINKYVRKDDRFLLVDKPNSGYGDSMNVGFDKACGEYLGIVESDDFVEPDMFEKLYDAAKKNNCEVVKSDYYEFVTADKKNRVRINTVIDPKYYNTVLNYKDTLSIFHFRMNTWTGVYLNEFIKKNGIRHNTTPGAAYQDNGFWFQTLSLAKRIMFLNEAFYNYRQDNPNSSINSKKKVFCLCDEYSYIEKFLDSNKNLHDDLYGIFLVKKYFNYMYTYNRIADEYAIPFLKRFSEEFRTPFNEGIIKKSTSDSRVLGIIERIVRDPVKFYYEDTVWRVQHASIDTALEMTNIKNNRYYKILNKLRLVS